MGGEFLARIKLALEGKDSVVNGLAETQRAAQQLTKTKITTIFDKQGLQTGKKIEETFSGIGKGAKKSFQAMGDFEKALRRVVLVAPVWMVFRTILQSVFSLINSQVKFLIDLENAMARIRIVGRGTEEEYTKLQSSLIVLSLAYGAVASSALEAAKIFAQQGRSIDQTITLTRISMIASQVLGTDMKTAVDDLTAAIESFNLPISDSIDIINKWINVEKNFAVTSKDLADATKVAGATANQMGITIDEFLGNVTAVIEVTRKSGSEAARGLQFIYARLLTTGADVLTQIAKVPVHLDNQKRATFALTDTYRSASDVLDDLASKWDGLTNKEKLSIAQNVASKRQLTIFMALMQNYNASLDARITSLSSAGKAEEAFGIIQETTTIKLNRLTTAWNNLTISFADTSAFKGTLDVSTELINGWAAIINIAQAYRNEAQKVKDDNQKITETQISQIKSLQELIELRDKYINFPSTETNIKMLEKITTAMKEVKSRSKIDIDINSKTAIENLNKFINTIEKQTIQQTVDIDIEIERTILKEKLESLKSSLPKWDLVGIFNPVKLIKDMAGINTKQKEIINVEKQLKNIEEKRKTILDEKYGKYETEKTQLEAQANLKKYDNEIETKLTDKELEKSKIQSKINILKQSGILTNEQILDTEIEIVNNSIFSYDIHEKQLKLMELESQRNDAILSDLKRKIDLREEILKLTGEEQSKIIREEIELKSIIYGYDYIKNNMEDRLRLAQALTKEADEQEKKSAHLVDLYKIANEYGRNVAQQISDYLGGLVDFAQLSGQAIEALQTQLPRQYEEAVAEKYFRNTFAQPLTFPETIEKSRISQRNRAILGQAGLPTQPTIPIINLPALTVKNDTSVFIDGKEIVSGVVERISTLIEQDGTVLSKIIEDKSKKTIEKY